MKKFLIAAMAASSLTLASCAQNPGPTDLAGFIKSVQAAAALVCGFEPTVQTVSDIFLSGNSTYRTVTGIVNAICGAVAPKATASRGGPTVAGVPVKGRFVR